MNDYLKVIAVVFVTVVVGAVVSKQAKDISVLIIILVCTMIMSVAAAYLQPILRFFGELESAGSLNSGMLKILLKAVGIGMLGEITALVCVDSGNEALGKTVRLLESAVILWIAMPLFETLLELVEGVLVMF